MTWCFRSRFALVTFLGMSGAGHALAQAEHLSIQEAVVFALEHRPEVDVSLARIAAAQFRRTQSGRTPNPRLTFRKENFIDHFGVGQDSQTYWEGEQLIEISGKRSARMTVASENAIQERLAAEQTRREIRWGVKESYWRAAASRELAKLYMESENYFSRAIAYHEARFHEGKIAEVDLLRVRLQGEEVRAAAATARLGADRALMNLVREMNAASNPNWVLSENLEGFEEPRLASIAANEPLNRIEEQRAKQSVVQAEALTKLEGANGRSDLLVTGGYKRDVGINTPVASLQFDLPIFNRNQDGVAAAKAEESAARAALRATRARLEADLTLARREYEMRREQSKEVFRSLRDRAVEISDISRSAYEAGGLDLVRLLDAERVRVSAQLSYVGALEKFHLAVVNLEYAGGVGE